MVRYWRFITLTGAAICLLAPALSAMAADVSGLGVPPAKGDACVEPTEVMRRNHMEFILHQRDLTVHEGIRTRQYSLTQCINCHVTPDSKGELARIDSPKHFCSSCHSRVAVSIDCFQCHSDQPEKSATAHRFSQQQLDDAHQLVLGEPLSPQEIDILTVERAAHE